MKNRHNKQDKRAPQSHGSGPATVFVTETVVLLSPTTTIMLAADGQSGSTADLEHVTSMDQKIIIILSCLCFGLLCVVAGLLIWFKKKPNRSRREQWEERGSETRRMSLQPSPLLVASPSSPDDRSSRTMSTTYSGQHLCSRVPREDGARTPGPLFDSERMGGGPRGNGEAERRSKAAHLTIDSAAIPYRKDERFGLTVPWTAGLSVEGTNQSLNRPGRTTRAISYPSDVHLHSPHTPDSSYPLISLSQQLPPVRPPSPTPSSNLVHRRLDATAVSPSPFPPESGIEKTGSPTPATNPSTVEPAAGLPLSPPPSPATITSRNAGSRSDSVSNRGQESHIRPPSSHRNSESVASPTSRPMTAASDARPTTSSTHLSLTSSYSAGSSTRFSTLFFAPASTPPKDQAITEMVGKEGEFAER